MMGRDGKWGDRAGLIRRQAVTALTKQSTDCSGGLPQSIGWMLEGETAEKRPFHTDNSGTPSALPYTHQIHSPLTPAFSIIPGCLWIGCEKGEAGFERATPSPQQRPFARPRQIKGKPSANSSRDGGGREGAAILAGKRP